MSAEPTGHLETADRLDTLARNILIEDALGPVVDALRSSGISPVALKGLALLQTIYADRLGDRPMSDVDLLVPPDRFAAAERIILDLGHSRTPGHQSTFHRRLPGAEIRIDLHRSLFHLDEAGLARFLGRCRPAAPGRLPVDLPSLEDLLLHVAVHAVVGHGHLRPAWIADLRGLIAEGPDWGVLTERTARHRLEVPLSVALDAVTRGESVTIPDSVRRELGPRGRGRVDRWILERSLARPETLDSGHFLRLVLRRGSGRRVRSMWRQLFPGPRFLRRRYALNGRSSLVMHAIARPFFTVARAARLLFRVSTPVSTSPFPRPAKPPRRAA